MPDPITTEDLYGTTQSSSESTVIPEPPPPVQAPIPVEETPEIPMEPSEGTPSSGQVPPPPPMPKVTRGSPVVAILLFILLFIAGILLSSYIRPLFTGVSNKLPSVSTTTPTVAMVVASPTPIDPFAGWHTLTVAGISYKLPPNVLAPTCDGTSCVSQGAFLPGGTRFTIAPKTLTQPFSLHGALITDVNGTAFTSHDATVSGHTAIEFSGTFAGRTSGGYGFIQMHGFMIEVTPTLTLEVNHFTPTGVPADFAKDDALFAQIISTLNLPPVVLPTATSTPTVIPTITVAPLVPTTPSTATTSGN